MGYKHTLIVIYYQPNLKVLILFARGQIQLKPAQNVAENHEINVIACLNLCFANTAMSVVRTLYKTSTVYAHANNNSQDFT